VRSSIIISLVLLIGIGMALLTSLLVKIWFPRLAVVVFLIMSACWIYAGWRGAEGFYRRRS
jgi:hypothetical protein